MKKIFSTAFLIIILTSACSRFQSGNSFDRFETDDIVSRNSITEELGIPTHIDTIEITWTEDEVPELYEYQNGILKNLRPGDKIVYEYYYYKDPVKKYFWFVPEGDSLRMVDKLEFNSKKVQY